MLQKIIFLLTTGACTLILDAYGLFCLYMRQKKMSIGSLETMENTIEGKKLILSALLDAIGEEGCGIACKEAEIFHDEEGWKMFLVGFMGPWHLGTTVDEAKASIREYAAMGFGLS